MSITSEQKAALKAAGYTVKGNTVLNKDGDSVGGYNENGKIWSGSGKVRDILKSQPAPKADKPASRPSSAPKKAESKPVKPKANPARNPGGARPEGKASGMPAKRSTTKETASAGIPVLGAAAAAKAASRKPAVAKPSNPTYSGRGKAPEGFQGRYNTTVGRPAVRGGARAIGGNPARRIGGGRTLKMPDVLDLRFMNKGGLVSRKK